MSVETSRRVGHPSSAAWRRPPVAAAWLLDAAPSKSTHDWIEFFERLDAARR
jgi:hypothetical protein